MRILAFSNSPIAHLDSCVDPQRRWVVSFVGTLGPSRGGTEPPRHNWKSKLSKIFQTIQCADLLWAEMGCTVPIQFHLAPVFEQILNHYTSSFWSFQGEQGMYRSNYLVQSGLEEEQILCKFWSWWISFRQNDLYRSNLESSRRHIWRTDIKRQILAETTWRKSCIVPMTTLWIQDGDWSRYFNRA